MGELLEIEDLRVTYPGRGRRSAPVPAVDGLSLTIPAGQTLGLVGESGSGKSTVGRAMLGLTPVASGRISLGGVDITTTTTAGRRDVARRLTVVFQDPYSSLNPALKIGETLAEPLVVTGLDRAAARRRVVDALAAVGLPADTVDRYPRQFSGGQRQRIAIARALVVDPEIVVCDEAVSALDLSIQAQVLNLLRDLQRETGIALLFITHDLTVVRHVSDRIAVLLQGRIMEQGDAAQVHGDPQHPYTQALLAASPVPDPARQAARRAEREALLRPVDPDLAARPAGELGCPFATRCPHRMNRCVTERPPTTVRPNGATVACHLFTGDAPASLPTMRAAADEKGA